MEKLLEDLAEILGGINYVIYLEAKRAPFVHHQSAENYVLKVYGDKYPPSKATPATAEELLKDLDVLLRYPGSEWCGPDAGVLDSPRFNTLMKQLFTELQQEMGGAELIARFTFDSFKHPFDSVFGDLSFVVASPKNGALVFVMGTSD